MYKFVDIHAIFFDEAVFVQLLIREDHFHGAGKCFINSNVFVLYCFEFRLLYCFIVAVEVTSLLKHKTKVKQVQDDFKILQLLFLLTIKRIATGREVQYLIILNK